MPSHFRIMVTIRYGLLALLSLAPSMVRAEVPSFVADAVQVAPGMEARSGKLHVGKLGTRFEFTEKGQQVVQIIQPSEGVFRLLFPKTKTYMEMRGKPATLKNGDRPVDPCRPDTELECRKEGDENIGLIAAERWIIKPREAEKAVTIWWDRQRRLPVRQLFPDGARLEADMTGSMKFEGREVEQWKMVLTPKTGAQQFSYMLFAPDLGIPVMEQGATGLVKELHNITPMEPDAALFELPEGYQKITSPAAPPQQPQ